MEMNEKVIIYSAQKNILNHKKKKRSRKQCKNQCNSNKKASIVRSHNFYEFESLSTEKRNSVNNIFMIKQKYRKDLFDKFSEFLDKKKFKISNNFDAKNSKKFLEKKNKCLEKIILSDIIENETNDEKEIIMNSSYKPKKKFRTQKSMHKYFIVISNYDEEKSKNSKKSNLVNNNIDKYWA
jgi:hypothetical protein